MKFVFIDTEFTSLHMYTTLISLGLVTLEGEELYLTLNDYDKSQVTPWVQENVLAHIDASKSMSRKEACERLGEFLALYAQDDHICMVSAGKMNDHLLVFELWHSQYPDMKVFHYENLPDFLYHDAHLDLHTLFFAAGIDPNTVVREKFLDTPIPGVRHDALYDAKVVRACFLKLARSGKLPHIAPFLPNLPES